MRDYFIRRLLLIPPVLVGISLMVFALTRMAPGGPIERAMMQMQQVGEEGGGGRSLEPSKLFQQSSYCR